MSTTEFREDLDPQLSNNGFLTLGHFYSDEREIDVAFGLDVLGDDLFYTITHFTPGRPDFWVFKPGDENNNAISHLDRLWWNSTQLNEEIDFAQVLGFDSTQVLIGEEDEIGYATIPTLEFVNASMEEVYSGLPGTEQFKYAVYGGPGGRVPGRLYIEALAQGIVLLSSDEDLSMFSHDMGDHLLGYCRIDPLTASFIKTSAQRLVDQDRLGVDELGKLTDPIAKAFASGVDLLSAYLNDFNPNVMLYKQYPNDRVKGIRDTRDHIRAILNVLEFGPISREIKVEQIYRGVLRHQSWLEDKASSLLAAA